MDGVYKKTVSLRASTAHPGRILYTAAFSAVGSHRIELRVAGSGSTYLDAFLVAK